MDQLAARQRHAVFLRSLRGLRRSPEALDPPHRLAPVPVLSVHKKMGYAEVRAAEMNLEKVRAECKARLEQAKPHTGTCNHSVHAVLVGRGARPISIVAPPHASTAQRSGPFSRATG